MTRKQVETLKINAALAVRRHADDTSKIMADINRLNDFVKQAFELHMIAKYDDVLKIQREIGQAAMAELEKLQREIA
jgi:hypothetical protein